MRWFGLSDHSGECCEIRQQAACPHPLYLFMGYSLGLATSVLWLGSLGDRYGRKLMLLIGTALAIPTSLLAAFAPSVEALIGARILGSLAAAMAYPTTLALITALWSGSGRTRSIALWSGLWDGGPAA
jgi:MFS transporter, DHA2 family, multidrug resistance protein